MERHKRQKHEDDIAVPSFVSPHSDENDMVMEVQPSSASCSFDKSEVANNGQEIFDSLMDSDSDFSFNQACSATFLEVQGDFSVAEDSDSSLLVLGNNDTSEHLYNNGTSLTEIILSNTDTLSVVDDRDVSGTESVADDGDVPNTESIVDDGNGGLEDTLSDIEEHNFDDAYILKNLKDYLRRLHKENITKFKKVVIWSGTNSRS